MEEVRNRPIVNHKYSRRLRTTFLILLLVTVSTGGFLTYLHFSARTRFAEVRDVATRIEVPVGAILLKESGEGNGLGAYACIDTHCPSYGRTFVISVQPGTEMQTLHGLLKAAGHRVTSTSSDASCVRQGDWNPICSVESVTDELLVSIGVQFPTQQWHAWVPQRAPPPGTEWRRLTVSAADY